MTSEALDIQGAPETLRRLDEQEAFLFVDKTQGQGFKGCVFRPRAGEVRATRKVPASVTQALLEAGLIAFIVNRDSYAKLKITEAGQNALARYVTQAADQRRSARNAQGGT